MSAKFDKLKTDPEAIHHLTKDCGMVVLGDTLFVRDPVSGELYEVSLSSDLRLKEGDEVKQLPPEQYAQAIASYGFAEFPAFVREVNRQFSGGWMCGSGHGTYLYITNRLRGRVREIVEGVIKRTAESIGFGVVVVTNTPPPSSEPHRRKGKRPPGKHWLQ